MSSMTSPLEVTSPVDSDHGFLLVFNTCFKSTVYRSQDICDFSPINNGRLSISAARGRLEAEVTLPFDSSIMVSYHLIRDYLSGMRHSIVIPNFFN
jgi:hypothetical protein